jgi:hypothetical protein
MCGIHRMMSLYEFMQCNLSIYIYSYIYICTDIYIWSSSMWTHYSPNHRGMCWGKEHGWGCLVAMKPVRPWLFRGLIPLTKFWKWVITKVISINKWDISLWSFHQVITMVITAYPIYRLVVWNIFNFSIQLAMSSSQLTNSIIFSGGRYTTNQIYNYGYKYGYKVMIWNSWDISLWFFHQELWSFHQVITTGMIWSSRATCNENGSSMSLGSTLELHRNEKQGVCEGTHSDKMWISLVYLDFVLIFPSTCLGLLARNHEGSTKHAPKSGGRNT